MYQDDDRFDYEPAMLPERRVNQRRVNQRTYLLFWSPTAQHIATVQASSPSAAKRKAPLPYRRFAGELYATDAMHMLWKPRTFDQ